MPMHLNPLNFCKVSRAITVTAGAAGTTDVAGVVCDMSLFEVVECEITLGALTTGGTCTFKWQQSSDDGVADAYSDLTGTLVTADVDADDEKIISMVLVKPLKRYVRVYNDRATANSVCSAVYRQYGPLRNEPVTQGSNVITSSDISPVEGTA